MSKLLFKRSAESSSHWWICTQLKSGKVIHLEALHVDVLSDFLGPEIYKLVEERPSGVVVEINIEVLKE